MNAYTVNVILHVHSGKIAFQFQCLPRNWLLPQGLSYWEDHIITNDNYVYQDCNKESWRNSETFHKNVK